MLSADGVPDGLSHMRKKSESTGPTEKQLLDMQCTL